MAFAFGGTAPTMIIMVPKKVRSSQRSNFDWQQYFSKISNIFIDVGAIIENDTNLGIGAWWGATIPFVCCVTQLP